MKTIELQTTIYSYESEKDLDEEAQGLVRSAKEALSSSYAPYSKFHVGAAVLLENGKIVKGANQENAAYPSGLCAERVALFSAGTQYPGVAVKAIAITISSDSKKSDPAAPCGACRQVMAEFESRSNQPIRVIMNGETGKVLEMKSINDLLPLMFKPESLGSK